MNDRITISITPELHSALFMAALEHRTSMSRTIENILRDAEEIRSIYLPKVREYSEDEEEIELSAASPRSLKERLRKEEEPEKEEDLGRRRGDLLDYGIIGYMLGPPPSYNKIVKMARKYGVDMPSDQKPHSKEKEK